MKFTGKNSLDWQVQGNKFVSRTMKQLSIMLDRISLFIKEPVKWLNSPLNSRHLRYEKEGKGFIWLNRLIESLEHPSHNLFSGFQHSGYEYSRSVKYKWFDPRYWMNEMPSDEIAEEWETAGDATEGITELTKSKKHPLSRIKNIQKTVSGIAAKYAQHQGSNDNAAFSPQDQVHFVEPVNWNIMPDSGEIPLPLSRNADSTGDNYIYSVPVEESDFPIPARQEEVKDNVSLTGFSPQYELQGEGQRDDSVPVFEKVWDKNPVAAQIEKSVNRIIKSLFKKDAVQLNSEALSPQKTVNSMKSFLKKYLSDRYYQSGEEVETSLIQQESGKRDFQDMPVIQPDDNMFNTIPVADAVPEEIKTPDYRMYEFGDSTQFEITGENRITVPFPNRAHTGAEPLSLPFPVSYPLPEVPVSSIPVSAGISQSAGSGPVHLAMAPLLRPMPEELNGGETQSQSREEPQRESEQERAPEQDPEQIAAEVYSIIKRRLLIEKERASGSF